MRYYLIAGEASGDLHAANLMRELQGLDEGAEFRFWGGDRMATVAGKSPVRHIKDLAFMGFYEVVANLRTILGFFKLCKKDLSDFQADALILVDYPGFNIRMAKWAKKRGIRVFYYISPQVWAWKKGRVHTIIAASRELFVILPFEEDFYKKYGYQVHYVGHPLLDEIQHIAPPPIPLEHDLPIIALLPGSRKQEISRMLPVMLSAMGNFTEEYRFVLAAAPGVPLAFYQEILGSEKVDIVQDNTYGILDVAYAALVTSGTATLEAALFGVPQVVCYKSSVISYTIAKRLVDIPYISLVNLILDRPLLKELIQHDLNTDNLTAALQHALSPKGREHILLGYEELESKLSKAGASRNVAEGIWGHLTAP